MTDNFIDEVDEELKRERRLALWNKYGRFAIGAVLVVVIAVAAVVGWNQYQRNRQVTSGVAYQNALDLAGTGNTDQALSAFRELAEDGSAGYADLARLQEAALLARQGDASAAADAYDRIARDGAAPEPFRNLALILYALTVADRADPVVLTERLAPLTVPSSPWRYSALEVTALMAERRGDRAAAADIFRRLADDPNAPQRLRGRAAEFLAITGE